MGLFDEIKAIFSLVLSGPKPPVITLRHLPGSPHAWQPAGVLVRHDTRDGSSYALHQVQPPPLRPAVAEHVVEATFASVIDLHRYISARGGVERAIAGNDLEGFVEARVGGGLLLRVTKPLAPENGGLEVACDRHPTFRRLAAPFGATNRATMDHEEIAAYLADNREELVNEAAVQGILLLQLAKTVEYDADMSTLGTVNVRASIKGTTSGLSVPREIVFRIDQPYVGLNLRRSDPFLMRLRVRMVLSKGSPEVKPTFELIWINSAELEREIEDAGVVALGADLASVGLSVYGGTCERKHQIIPSPIREDEIADYRD